MKITMIYIIIIGILFFNSTFKKYNAYLTIVIGNIIYGVIVILSTVRVMINLKSLRPCQHYLPSHFLHQTLRGLLHALIFLSDDLFLLHNNFVFSDSYHLQQVFFR